MSLEEKRVGVFTRIFRNEPTMHQAIKSVLNQTYKNLKLYILVGEKTRDELMKYAEQDSRVVIMDRAVDEGFHVYAKEMVLDGNEYICTIDADDWYAENYLEELVNFAQRNNTDFTAAGNFFVNLESGKIAVRKQFELVYSREEFGTFFSQCYMFFRTVWGKLYHASLILQYDIGKLPQAKEYGGYGGDTFFVLNLLRHVKRVGIIDKALYFYRMSSTSVSHRLQEGRINSDEMLLQYAEELLKELNGVSVKNQLFLWVVYGNALLDTIRLLLNVQIDETERVGELLLLFRKASIREFIGLDNQDILVNFVNEKEEKKFVEKFRELVFINRLEKVRDEKVLKEYLELLEIWYPQIKGVMTVKEFDLLLSKDFLLNAFLDKKYEELHDCLLDCISEAENKELCNNFLIRLSNNQIHKEALMDGQMASYYPDLIKLLQKNEFDDALAYCISLFENSEMISCGETVLDIWVKLAALKEDISTFILGKEIKVEYLYQQGKISDAEKEYNGLVEMGVSDENMEYLKHLLIG